MHGYHWIYSQNFKKEKRKSMFLSIYFYSEVFVKKQKDSLVQDYNPLHAITKH